MFVFFFSHFVLSFFSPLPCSSTFNSFDIQQDCFVGVKLRNRRGLQILAKLSVEICLTSQLQGSSGTACVVIYRLLELQDGQINIK